MTVRNSLLPTFITNAAINAGAAAEVAEVSKDTCHEAHVVAAGGSFFPLVVETLGLWTPSSVNTLKSIASKISGISNISFSQSYNNLMQQLSTKLWSFNAKMILQRLLLERECRHT